MADTTLLQLPLLAAAQAQKHVTHNDALLRLDALVQLAVIDRDLTAPPGSPSDGDRYIPASGATGDWEGWDLNIAWYVDGVWTKLVPREGWTVWVADEDVVLFWDGSTWGAPEFAGGLRSGEGGFSPSVNDNAAYFATGSFGGGYILADGAGRGGMWLTDGGATLNLAAGGASSGFGSALGDLMLNAGRLGIGIAPAANVHIYEDNTSEVATELLRLDNPSTHPVNNGMSLRFYQGAIPQGRIRNYWNGSAWVFTFGSGADDQVALDNLGQLRFASYGAGDLQTDASGNVSAVSDERLKDDIQPFAHGLDAIRQINPISYHWNAKSGLDRLNRYAGFSAQEIEHVIPEAIGVNADGYLSLNTRPIISALVNAIKELDARLTALEDA